ncbi:hypothetical protein [Aquisalibacillus elongatus]|uniref:Uncharacterized protein n=1 Tax=Aquisalibacillus elongatus TaxID=485577 RepID=A0A3N5CHI4_9BACI|nr:hypothetical protein [Aquisalibacillus elongatus]RPF57021.1 hypothetical protein EDC24_0068 [Aquisalibacillus elongatus]
MKRILLIVSIVLIITSVPTTLFASTYLNNNSLTEAEITEKVMKIADKYDIGEKLSKNDQKLIESYLGENKTSSDFKVESKGAQLQEYISESKYNNNGTIGVWVAGDMWQDIQNIVNQSYGGEITAYGVGVDGRDINRIDVEIRHVAFGPIGSGGTYIGLVYDDAISSSCNTYEFCKADGEVNYDAWVAYASAQAIATVTYPSGSVTLATP